MGNECVNQFVPITLYLNNNKIIVWTLKAAINIINLSAMNGLLYICLIDVNHCSIQNVELIILQHKDKPRLLMVFINPLFL